MNEFLPPKPEKPREEDCCGSGCALCVFDIYNQQLKEWEKACSEVKQRKSLQTNSGSPVLTQFCYTPFQVQSIVSHTSDSNIYRFQAVEISSEIVNVMSNLDIRIGQHLMMKSDQDGTFLTRAYTPISDSSAHSLGYFDILVKLYADGPMSNYIKSLTNGDIVHWKGPFGNFQYIKNTYKYVLLICAGTGIAPMIQIIKTIVENEEEETFVRLLYSCKKYTEVLLADEILALTSYWNFSQCTFITRENPQNVRYGENVVSGRITQVTIQKELANKELEHILVLICGTRSFNKDIINFALQASVARNNIFIF